MKQITVYVLQNDTLTAVNVNGSLGYGQSIAQAVHCAIGGCYRISQDIVITQYGDNILGIKENSVSANIEVKFVHHFSGLSKHNQY